MKKSRFPRKGRSPAAILKKLEQLRREDIQWKAGKAWSLVYYLDDGHQDLIRRSYDLFFAENYLNSFAFPSLQLMERDVVSMAAELCHEPSAVGTMTSGGTESILLSVLSYRESASRKKKNNGPMEILASSSVHPAFEKAAHLFGLKLVRVPVDKDFQLDIEAFEKKIGPRTLMLVASAPCYPHGLVEPVREVGELALRYKLPFHVDACLGGFFLPWAEELGYWDRPWDFRVPGVTSISLDLHKFGFGAKGASVVLYREMDQLKRQFFISTEFPGGIYVSPTLLGTRPGGAIAAAWAAIRHLGREGYLAITEQLMEASEKLRAFFSATEGLELVGEPRLNLLAYRTVGNRPDIFVLADYLEKKGWMVDRQQFPQCIHLTVLPSNLPALDAYANDVLGALEFARAHPEAAAEGNAAMYGLMARIPFRKRVEAGACHLFEELYKSVLPLEKKTVAEAANDKELSPSRWMGRLNRVLAWWERRK